MFARLPGQGLSHGYPPMVPEPRNSRSACSPPFCLLPLDRSSGPPLDRSSGPAEMLTASLIAVGLVVSPAVRTGAAVRPYGARMCDAPKPAVAAPEPAALRESSLLDEMEERMKEPMGGMTVAGEFRAEMVAAYAALTGEDLPPEGALGDKPMPKKEIDLAQFGALFASLGDDLPADKLKSMFDAVDSNGDGAPAPPPSAVPMCSCWMTRLCRGRTQARSSLSSFTRLAWTRCSSGKLPAAEGAAVSLAGSSETGDFLMRYM